MSFAEDTVPATPTPIPGNYTNRSTPTKSVWELQNYNSWRDIVWGLLHEIVDEEVKRTFIASLPEFVVSDDLSWLDDAIFRTHQYCIDSKSYLADKLLERYASVRVVHGTRLDSPAPIYKHGLSPLISEVMNEKARAIFLTEEFPELSEQCLQNAIDTVGTQTREGHVYFACSERDLIDYSPHYMQFGSEYLLCIAANLGQQNDYRQILKRYGLPTVFVCDVPFSLMKKGTILEFAGTALEMIFEELLNPTSYHSDHYRWGGFSISQVLPVSCIVGHYHPSNLKNFHV